MVEAMRLAEKPTESEMRAPSSAAEKVTPELIGAQPELSIGRYRLATRGQADIAELLVVRVWCHPGSGHGDAHEEEHHHRGNGTHRYLLLGEASPDVSPPGGRLLVPCIPARGAAAAPGANLCPTLGHAHSLRGLARGRRLVARH